MTDVYFIKKETLTASADKIRLKAPINWGSNSNIDPIDFPDAIDDVWQEGYDGGYSSGYNQGNSEGYSSGYNQGKSDGETTGYNNGYNAGYDKGYEVGDVEGYDIGYDEGYVEGKRVLAPLAIQGLNSTNNYGLYDTSIFNTSVGGTTYTFGDFADYETVGSSSEFTMSVINNTAYKLFIQVDAECDYIDGSQEWGHTVFTITVNPNSSKSNTVYIGESGQGHQWSYTIQGVEFYE